jgi:hypothetical protein
MAEAGFMRREERLVTAASIGVDAYKGRTLIYWRP